jgi:hypothetical protein
VKFLVTLHHSDVVHRLGIFEEDYSWLAVKRAQEQFCNLFKRLTLPYQVKAEAIPVYRKSY